MPATGHKHGWKTKKKRRKFKNCEDAGRQMQEDAANGVHWGEANWDVSATTSHSQVKQQDDGTWTASTTVHRTLNQRGSSVVVDQPYWPGMTSDDHDAVDAATGGLEDHENGHLEIAKDFADTWGDGDGNTSLTGTGSTRQDAVNDLRDKISQDAKDFTEGLQKREDDYDDFTGHGTKQSDGPDHKDADGDDAPYPGGQDSKLTCPGG